MSDSIFDINSQQENLSGKTVIGLERIAEVFKLLLWDQAKTTGLSPIQIQILVFIAFHKPELCNVSHLAREFNITKPTVSDAVRVLLNKNLIQKQSSLTDSRSYTIGLTDAGQEIVKTTGNFTKPIEKQLKGIKTEQLESLYGSVAALIGQLHDSGILSVQRTCTACRFYSKEDGRSYCNLLEKSLETRDIRLDCPEFESKP